MDSLDAPAEAFSPTPTDGVSIILPNYNGCDLLKLYLQFVVDAAGRSRVPVEIIVADDCSSDESVEYVRTAHPQVTLLESESNCGFGENCNRAARASRYSRLLFLNTDMKVEPDFVDPLIDALDASPDMFAVSCKIVEEHPETGAVHVGFNYGYFKRGVIHPQAIRLSLDNPADDRIRPILWACGGAMLCDRTKFFELGGFDPIYSPFYWEDTDLSYQAWKRGWKVHYVPASVVHHKQRGTIVRFNQSERIEAIMERNRLLFMMKNVTDPGRVAAFALHYAFRVVARRRLKELGLTSRGPKALPISTEQRRTVSTTRRRLNAVRKLTDAEVLQLFTASKQELVDADQRLSTDRARKTMSGKSSR